MIRALALGDLNHDSAIGLNPPSSVGYVSRRFWGKADINQQAKPVGSVENDPKPT
jgi:hypothetical protein